MAVPAKAQRRRKRRSFIEEARRRQILQIAMDEIDRNGYRNTSVDAIAARAGISKGAVYYHFAGKRELAEELAAAIVDELFEYRKRRVEAQSCARDKLRAYVDAYFDFVCRNVRKFAAIVEAGIDTSSQDRGNPWGAVANERAFRYIEEILTEGQRGGEFRTFDAAALAPVIQGALDGLVVSWFSYPDGVGLEACKGELHRMIEACTDLHAAESGGHKARPRGRTGVRP
jgi:AcrR family transcriptional regulator